MNGVWHGQSMIFSFVVDDVNAARTTTSLGRSAYTISFLAVVPVFASLHSQEQSAKAGWILVSDRSLYWMVAQLTASTTTGTTLKIEKSDCSALIFPFWTVLS